MASSTAKRLILYRFDRQPLEALVHTDAYLREQHVEVITLDGNLQSVDYAEVKALCFASDSGPADLFTENTSFEHRPKLTGLWTSFSFRDGDRLEGILPRNLLDWPKQGYVIIPPRAGATRQRVFIPRQAVRETVLRGVIGTSHAPKRPKGPVPDPQLSMFD